MCSVPSTNSFTEYSLTKTGHLRIYHSNTGFGFSKPYCCLFKKAPICGFEPPINFYLKCLGNIIKAIQEEVLTMMVADAK